MKKTLLLLAGSPGTGKTYLDNWIRREISGFNESSIDVFKEQLYDNIGFDSLEERYQLDDQAYALFYAEIEKLMLAGKSIISDYPFSYRQHDILKDIAEKYDFQIVTITLIADLETLYERRLQRDADIERHLGHVMTHYHKGDVLQDRAAIEIKASRDEVEAFNKKRKYDEFKLGTTFVLDVSDFETADYAGVIDKIKKMVL